MFPGKPELREILPLEETEIRNITPSSSLEIEEDIRSVHESTTEDSDAQISFIDSLSAETRAQASSFSSHSIQKF